MRYTIAFAAILSVATAATTSYGATDSTYGAGSSADNYDANCPAGTVPSAKGACICPSGASYNGKDCSCDVEYASYIVGADNSGSCSCSGDYKDGEDDHAGKCVPNGDLYLVAKADNTGCECQKGYMRDEDSASGTACIPEETYKKQRGGRGRGRRPHRGPKGPKKDEDCEEGDKPSGDYTKTSSTSGNDYDSSATTGDYDSSKDTVDYDSSKDTADYKGGKPHGHGGSYRGPRRGGPRGHGPTGGKAEDCEDDKTKADYKSGGSDNTYGTGASGSTYESGSTDTDYKSGSDSTTSYDNGSATTDNTSYDSSASSGTDYTATSDDTTANYAK